MNKSLNQYKVDIEDKINNALPKRILILIVNLTKEHSQLPDTVRPHILPTSSPQSDKVNQFMDRNSLRTSLASMEPTHSQNMRSDSWKYSLVRFFTVESCTIVSASSFDTSPN